MDTLLKVLDETTALTLNDDLFAYEIPLGKTGVWLSDSQTDSRFNSVDIAEFANIRYLKEQIDFISTEVCELDNGLTFKLQILFNWDYLEKDAEGYFVFANRLRLIK